MRSRWLWVALLLWASPGFAQNSSPSPQLRSLTERAARRFPQPVRVGDLIGRDVLEPTEAQHILGQVRSVVRSKDGSLEMIVAFGGVLGIGARPIAVPVDAMALLGQFVACMEFTPDQLRAFPTEDGAEDTQLAANDTIKVGVVKPFH